MKRTPLGPGRKSLERGSTFAGQHELARRKPPARTPIAPASPAQRDKVRGLPSIVSGQHGCDPAHLWPRSQGGCDHPDCVIPLTRHEHRLFDDGQLDLLPHLITAGCWAELAHMVDVHHVDPIAMLNRLTGERWAPEAGAVARR